jgi:hypothetical protein
VISRYNYIFVFNPRGIVLGMCRNQVAVYHPTASLIFSAKKVIPSLHGHRL